METFGRRKSLLLISSIAKIMVWANRNSLRLTLRKKSKIQTCIHCNREKDENITSVWYTVNKLPGTCEVCWLICKGKRRLCDFAVNGKGSPNHDISLFRQQRELWTAQYLTDRRFLLRCSKCQQEPQDNQSHYHMRHFIQVLMGQSHPG